LKELVQLVWQEGTDRSLLLLLCKRQKLVESSADDKGETVEGKD
jgi:hypothetical protein